MIFREWKEREKEGYIWSWQFGDETLWGMGCDVDAHALTQYRRLRGSASVSECERKRERERERERERKVCESQKF